MHRFVNILLEHQIKNSMAEYKSKIE